MWHDWENNPLYRFFSMPLKQPLCVNSTSECIEKFLICHLSISKQREEKAINACVPKIRQIKFLMLFLLYIFLLNELAEWGIFVSTFIYLSRFLWILLYCLCDEEYQDIFWSFVIFITACLSESVWFIYCLLKTCFCIKKRNFKKSFRVNILAQIRRRLLKRVRTRDFLKFKFQFIS